MNRAPDFERLSAWLGDEMSTRASAHLLNEVLADIVQTPRRPAWRIPERWIPMRIAFALAVIPRALLVALTLILLGLVGAATFAVAAPKIAALAPPVRLVGYSFEDLAPGRYLLAASPSGSPIELTFKVDESTPDSGTLNGSLLELGWPNGPHIDIWWRVGGVNGNPCVEADDPGYDAARVVTAPTPSQSYELIRTASIFEASEETPFPFAAATGRSVDITAREGARARCAAVGTGDGVVLTHAGKGYLAGQILSFPLDGAMRLATVEIDGHELLMAVTGSSVADLDRANEVIDSFEAERPPAAKPASAAPSPMASRVDIGDRSLYLTCQGQGEPTIMLMNGAGNDTSSWSGIIDELAAISRVCAYDRANTGRSDPAPTPRSMADGADELLALMAAAGIDPPVVLVGHSMGGLAARMAAVTHPAAVAGIVLVDAPPADFFPDRGCPKLSETACELLGTLMGPNGEGFDPTAEDLAAIRGEVFDLPVRVLAATHHDVAEAGGDEIEVLAADMQTELAASMPQGVLVVAEGSGHYIQEDRPELVIEAVAEVVRAARTADP